MPTKGTYTAYSQLKPLQGDVSQDIQQQEENGFKRRTEKRYEDKIAQDKTDKEAAKKQALWDKHVKPLSNYDTGSKTLNEVQGKLLLQAQKEYVPLMAVINNPKSSDEDRLKATLKLDNINKLPDNMKAMTENLTKRDLAIKKGVADGSLWANPEYDKNYQEGFENKILALDENGMPMIAFKNPDGSTDLETYDQIQNVVKKYDFSPRFDREKELLEASTKLQPQTNQTDDGVKRIETTEIDSNLLKTYVSNQMFEADGVTPTPKLKSFAKDSNVALTDTDGLQKLAKGFEDDIRLRVKGGTKVTRNYNKLDELKEANDERARKRAEAKDDEDNPAPVVVNASNTAFTEDLVKPVRYKGKDGKIHVTNPSIKRENLLPKGYSFPKGVKKDNIGGEKSGLNNITINTVFKGKDGKMYFTAKVLDTKTSGNNADDEGKGKLTKGSTYKAVSRQATGETAAEIAKAMGYNSADEALNAIDELNGIDPSKKETKKVYAGVDENGKIIYK